MTIVSFSRYLRESKKNLDTRHHVEMYLYPNKPPAFRVTRTDHFPEHPVLEEGSKPYHPDEEDHISGALYKNLGEFKPSTLDHETVAKEFHEHLHKHGYYMHTATHPMVMSPKDQKFKSEFKRHIAKNKNTAPNHEKPHHDGQPGRAAVNSEGKKIPSMGRHVGLWSTKGSTHIYNKNTNERIPDATKDNHVSINNDEKTKHSASGEKDRWFLRAGEIRKLPPHGLVSHTGKRYGNDIKSYIADKAHNIPKHHQDVADYFNDKRGRNSTPEEKEKTMEWMKKKHPEYHDAHKSGKLQKKGFFIK